MAYADDLDSDHHRRAFYVAFAGIERRFSTHDLTGIVTGQFSVGLLSESLSGGDRTLDMQYGVVTDSGLSFTITDGDAARATFRRRGGTETSLAVALTSSGNEVTLGSGAATYANGSTIYLGSETIILGTHSGSGVYASCTRGAFNSTATAHAVSEVISSVPRKWFTRRVTLYEVMLDTGTEAAVWYGALSESPSWAPGLRMFSATSRMDEWLTRPICTGFKDYQVDTSTMIISSTAGTVFIDFADATEELEFAVAANGAWLRVDIDGLVGFFFFEEDELTSSGLTLRLDRQLSTDVGGLFSTAFTLTQFQNASEISVRQIELVNGPLSAQALAVIRSRVGNDSFDVLPGRDSNAAGTSFSGFFRKRMGAGIPSGEVNVSSWQAINGGSTTELDPLFGEERLGSYLERLLWRTGGYAYQDGNGRLAWKKFDGVAVRGAVTAYDAESEILHGDMTATDDEADAPGTATVRGSFSLTQEEYKRSIDLAWFDDADLYGDRDGRYTYESRSAKLGTGSAGWSVLEQSLDRMRARRIYAGRRTSYRIKWRYRLAFLPGTRVSITDSRLDDSEGGVGVSGRYYEVIRYTPDFVGGFIVVELDEIYRSSVVAPSARVQGTPAGGANPTITLASGGQYDDDGNPANDFPIGCTIEIRDATDNYLTTTTLVIASRPSGTQLATTGTPGFTLAGNDLVEMKISGDTGNVNDVSADVEDFGFAADSGLLIDSGGDERDGPRWG